ncbi:type II secretion system F family protein [Candidatus Gracilibacteria bacterium]|nr:type II secretion system F family protein [Candidatus Gracilibacteria bacterium]MCF7898738.1 type II secretion system F family protein [Candidatus Paceibacterota bacterium]
MAAKKVNTKLTDKKSEIPVKKKVVLSEKNTKEEATPSLKDKDTKDVKNEETSTSAKITKGLESDVPSAPAKATPKVLKLNEKRLGYFETFGLTKERDHFIENLSMLVLSGMPIMGALTAITRDTKNPQMKKILEGISVELDAGSPLWKSFDRTNLFKGYTVSLMRIGEESGKFAENLKVVAEQQEKDRNLKSKVKSALMYPAFVMVLVLVIGLGISWFILPKLAKIFADLKLDLPLITKILIGFGLFLQENGIWVVPLGIFIAGTAIYFIFIYEKTKWMGESFLYAIPGINTLMMEVEVARFGYLLGTLLDAGLPITKAIDSLTGASDSIRYKKFYTHLNESIDMGNSFQKSFVSYSKIDKLIPQPMQQLVFSGEQSGNLNKTLLKIGQVLEEKSDTTTKNLTIIMEPILLVIVWLGVVAVAFAVILPIYSLVGGINTI